MASFQGLLKVLFIIIPVMKLKNEHYRDSSDFQIQLNSLYALTYLYSIFI